MNRLAPGIRIGYVRNEKDVDVSPIDLTDRVMSFTFEDDEKKADKFSLVLNNSDLSLFDVPELQGGSLLQITWGYPGNLAPSRRMEIKKMKGFTELTIEGHALSFRLNRETKIRCWENKTRSEVVREVAKSFGYEGGFAHIEDTTERIDVINQAAETDARFLRRLAQEEDFVFYVDDSGLHWHERQQGTPPLHEFTWYADKEKSNVLSISVESDLTRRVGGIKVKGRDPKTKETNEAEAHNDNVDRDTLGDVVEVLRIPRPEMQRIQEIGVVDYEDPLLEQSIQQVPVYAQDLVNEQTVLIERNAIALDLAISAAADAETAQKAAARRFKKAERKTVKMNMTVVGDPTIRAKCVVEVKGLPVSMAGKYYVHSVKHSVSSSGYECELKMTRDAKGILARSAGLLSGRRNRQKRNEDYTLMRYDEKTSTMYTEYYNKGRNLTGYIDHRTQQSIQEDADDAEKMTWQK